MSKEIEPKTEHNTNQESQHKAESSTPTPVITQNQEENVVSKQPSETKVEPKKEKYILPGLRMDDFILIVAGLAMVIFIFFFMDDIFHLLHDYKFKPTGTTEEPSEGAEEEKLETTEKTLTCKAQNSLEMYIYDIEYIVSYKDEAYQITYGIKFLESKENECDPNDTECEPTRSLTAEEFMKMEEEKVFFEDYISYFETYEGMSFTKLGNGNFIQNIDLTKIDRDYINSYSTEVMFFNKTDSFENIKTAFEERNFICE